MAGGWFNASSRLRRFGVLLFAAVAAGAGFIPWPVPAQFFLSVVDRAMPQDSGLAVNARARAHFTLLPAPTVRLRDVTLAHADFGLLATVQQLAIRLRLLPIIAGDMQIDDMVAQGVVAQASPATRTPWLAMFGARVGGSLRTAITVSDARLQLGGGIADVTQVNGRVARDQGSGLASVWGEGNWNGQPVKIQGSGLPVGQQQVAGAAARLTIQTPLATLTASGGFEADRGTGSLQLTMVNASALAQWLGRPVPMAGLLDGFILSGTGIATSRGVQLADATLQFGPNILKGTMAYAQSAGERPLISGTLATDSIELNAIAGAFDAVQDASGGWSADRFDTGSLLTADLDLRISAGRARVMKVALAGAALSATLRNGRLDLALGRSSAYGGTLRARASITRLGDTLTEQKLQTSFENVDFGKFSDDMFGMRLLSGIATGQFQAESTGSSPQSIVGALSGRSQFTVRQGEITGISLAETIRRAEREQTLPVAMQMGATRFDNATVSLAIHHGVAQITEGQISGIGTQASLGGQVLLAAREYRISGQVQHPLRPRQWPFEITGPWAKPVTQALPRTGAQRGEPPQTGAVRPLSPI